MTNKLTLIKRTDPICPACITMANILEGEEIPFDTIDITDAPEAIEEYDLTGVPVMIIRDNDGEITDRLVGVHPADAVKAKLAEGGR